MNKIKNVIYLGLFLGVLFLIKFLVVDVAFINMPQDANIWFSSGLILIILGLFITEKNFTSPVNVIVNIITVLVILFMLNDKGEFRLWGSLVYYCVTVGVIAIISFMLVDEKKDKNDWTQKIAESTNIIASFLGSSKFVFSIIFILSIFNYFVFSLEESQEITQQQIAILCMLIFWGSMILIEPIDRRLIQPIIKRFTKKIDNSLIGSISAYQTPNIVIVEQFPNSPELEAGDLAVIKTKNNKDGKIQGNDNLLSFIGFYDSNSHRFLKFYFINSKKISDIKKQTFVYKVNKIKEKELTETIAKNDFYKRKERMIGFIHSGSDIDTIRIKMIDEIDDAKKLENGDLVSVSLYGQETKYQIINAQTAIESIENSSDIGFKIITAQQIGSWDAKEQKFVDNSWVPVVNTPVYLENESEKIKVIKKGCYKVGYVPKSGYPILLDLKDSINHHIAIIGKTGTGKSLMSAKIIEELTENDCKVIILEVDQKNRQSLSMYIDKDKISSENVVWSFKEKKRENSSEKYNECSAKINFQSDDGKNIFIINWDDNSEKKDDGPLSQADATAAVIMRVLAYQMKNPNSRVCIVMEEAYDFIPENTFGKQDFGQPAVSRISQLVLKCRKHNVGFFIITQRTALVSKTILNQCHTIIALQSFDETSRTFLGSYVNQKYLDSMSILPSFRAMIVGKGSSCDKPIVVDFFDPKIAEEEKRKKALVVYGQFKSTIINT